MWIYSHGHSSHYQGCIGTVGGDEWLNWHDCISSLVVQYQRQCLATKQSCVPTLSSLGFLGDHHAVVIEVVYFLALGQLSDCLTVDNHPEYFGSSNFLEWGGWNSDFTDLGQPCLTNLRTEAITGLRSVHLFICLMVTGKILRVSIKNTSSSGIGISLGCTGKGSQLSTSAFAWSLPGTYWTL